MLYCTYNLLDIFRHLYAHYQEFETTLVFLPHMVCDALVAGGRRSGAGQQAMRPGWGKLLPPAVVLPCVLLHRLMFVAMPPRDNFCQRDCPACYRWDPGSIPAEFMCYKSGSGANFFFRIFKFYRVSFHQPSTYRWHCVILAVDRVVLYNTPVSRFWSALGLLTCLERNTALAKEWRG